MRERRVVPETEIVGTASKCRITKALSPDELGRLNTLLFALRYNVDHC